MSLSKLPTELDDRILGHLEQGDASSMSQASKYYREVSENHLYKNIRFNTHEGHRIKRLLITLWNRTDLHHLIQQLTVSNDHSLPYLAPPEVDDFVSIGSDTHQAEICTSLMANALKVDAFSAGLATHKNINAQLKMAMSAEVFEPYPLYD